MSLEFINDKKFSVWDRKTTKPFNIKQVTPETPTAKDFDWTTTLQQLDKQSDVNLAFTFLVEILRSSDPRFNIPEYQQAIVKELNGLKDRKVFEIVNESEINNDYDYVILEGKLIVALTNVGILIEQY